MNRRTLGVCAVAVVAAFALGRVSGGAQDPGPAPSCDMCDADFVPAEELESYERVADATGLTDLQVRSLDIGKANVQIALVKRGALEAPAAVTRSPNTTS